MGRMAPLPQDEEGSPTSTAHFPFGLSHDPYDTFVKQQLMLLEDELRSLEVEDTLVQELSEPHCINSPSGCHAGQFDLLLAFRGAASSFGGWAVQKGHDPRKLHMLATLPE
ncbi:unnamed protein product [Symbiodinium sp. CCMP2456]|nr:unnamed protein product [Symbiodinium sp. CCMP2456]